MLQTCLNRFHREYGAKLVDFAGWEMPVMYRGIVEEHRHTRAHCSLFDVSHMGRLHVTGPRAEAFLQRVCTRNLADMPVGLSRYSHICNEQGGILDDVIVSRFDEHYLIVCNAGNTAKILAWLQRVGGEFGVEIVNMTCETAMIALQGPEAMGLIAKFSPLPMDGLKRYHFKHGDFMGAEFAVFRSGYTGEDGVEVVLPASLAATAVQMMIGQLTETDASVKPAGLGARDTLRLEAGMPLYGHELSESYDSISAGQGWAVDLSKDFIGQPALQEVKQNGPKRKLTGFEVAGRRIAREGALLYAGGAEVGVITSGTHSPTFDKVIAMGYLETSLCEPGRAVEVDIRGSRSSAMVVKLPFYKRAKE